MSLRVDCHIVVFILDFSSFLCYELLNFLNLIRGKRLELTIDLGSQIAKLVKNFATDFTFLCGFFDVIAQFLNLIGKNTISATAKIADGLCELL